jgi:hypothetical protein
MSKVELDVGILNDEHTLYLCVIVGNESDRRQIMARGMTLWFSPSGGDQKALGIHYPIGFSNSDLGPAEMRALAEEMRERQRSGDSAGAPSDGLAARFEASLAIIEILQGKDAPYRYDPGAVPGIQVKVKASSSSLVYELAMPLDGDSPFALHAVPGAKLGIELSTPDIDLAAMQDEMQGGEGLAPGGGMGGSGPSGRPPAGRMLPPDSLDLKAKVELAKAPN